MMTEIEWIENSANTPLTIKVESYNPYNREFYEGIMYYDDILCIRIEDYLYKDLKSKPIAKLDNKTWNFCIEKELIYFVIRTQ